MNSPSSTSGTEGVAAPTAPVVPNTREGIPTDTNATTAPAADSTPCMRTGDAERAAASIARADARTMALLRAILSTITTDRARALLVALAAWWHAVVALAANHTTAARVVAEAAYDAADEHGDATTCAALVGAFVGVGASTLHDIACDPREASEAKNHAASALPMIDALLAELDHQHATPKHAAQHTEHVEGQRVALVPRRIERHPDAPADPREAFARALLEFSAEHDVAALALVGAEVMFPDYAGCSDAMEVRKAVTAVCETVTAPLTEASKAHRGTVDIVDATERAALALRDAARVIVAASHLLDASIAVERARCEVCK